MLSDDEGQSRVALGAIDPGKYEAWLQDAKGVPRIVLAGNAEDVWGISFVDPTGKPFFGVPFGPALPKP